MTTSPVTSASTPPRPVRAGRPYDPQRPSRSVRAAAHTHTSAETLATQMITLEEVRGLKGDLAELRRTFMPRTEAESASRDLTAKIDAMGQQVYDLNSWRLRFTEQTAEQARSLERMLERQMADVKSSLQLAITATRERDVGRWLKVAEMIAVAVLGAIAYSVIVLGKLP